MGWAGCDALHGSSEAQRKKRARSTQRAYKADSRFDSGRDHEVVEGDCLLFAARRSRLFATVTEVEVDAGEQDGRGGPRWIKSKQSSKSRVNDARNDRSQ